MDKELVIARWNENVDWCKDSPFPCTVYNHGEPIDLDHPMVDVVDLPNRGREAGVWLEHCVENFEHLADWTFFVQGEPHQAVQTLWNRLGTIYSDTTPLTAEYLPNFPSDEAKALDAIEDFEGFEAHWGDADRFGDRQPEENRQWLEAIWRQYFDCPQPKPWRYGYCAMYAVPKHRITDRPMSWWLWLREVVNKDDNSVEMTTTSAWALESIFGYLFGDATRYPVRMPKKTPMTALDYKRLGIPLPKRPCCNGRKASETAI